MTNNDQKNADRLIKAFLEKTPNPQTPDWKRLIDANPNFSGAIADAAIELDRSFNADESSALAVNDRAFNATISNVLNAVHQTPAPLLDDAKAKVDASLGPKAKQLAVDVGIGVHTALLNGILVGRILAPGTILKALSKKLDAPVAALSEVFARAFAASEAPAFKAPNGQPQIMTKPQTWAQSVAAMQLPAEEAERLLALSSEG